MTADSDLFPSERMHTSRIVLYTLAATWTGWLGASSGSRPPIARPFPRRSL
jgi:hypothetical protein